MRPALATALVLSAVRTVGAEPCAPRAELGGDGVAVERVAAELRRLGVTVASRPNASLDDHGSAAMRDGCTIVRAQVALDEDGGIAVAVRGATRGSEGRVVSDAALAAAWIDSWARDDDVALWGAPPPRVARAPSQPPATSPVVDAPPIAQPAVWERFAIAVVYEQGYTDDDASWSGASASACVRVAGFCIGGRARIAFDGERLYNATAVSRDDYSLLATAGYPIEVGRMSFAPEAGLGIGRFTTRRSEGECKMPMPMSCDPMDPNCMPMPPACEPTNPGTMTTPKTYVGDGFTATTYTPRIALALRVAIPLFQHVWLDGLAGLSFAPFGHTDELASTGTMNDPVTGSTALPGEPSTGYVLGVGLRLGAK